MSVGSRAEGDWVRRPAAGEAAAAAADSDRAAPDKRVIIGAITGVVRGDDIGQLLLRDGLLLAGVPLLDFIHHGDDTVETLGHAGPHPVLKE